MSDNRKIKEIVYSAKPGEIINNFMEFLLSKFDANNVEKVSGIHNCRKITIEELDDE